MAQKKQKRKQVAKRAKAYGKVKYTQPGEAAFYKEVAKRERFVEKYSKSKYSKADLEKLKKIKPSRGMTAIKKYSKTDWAKLAKKYGDVKTAKVVKKIPKKSLARRLVGKTLSKAIPGVGGAMIAHDVMRAGAKKGCIKRGGKWVGGKCQVAKKSRKKTGGPDPRFAKSRSKK